MFKMNKNLNLLFALLLGLVAVPAVAMNKEEVKKVQPPVTLTEEQKKIELEEQKKKEEAKKLEEERIEKEKLVKQQEEEKKKQEEAKKLEADKKEKERLDKIEAKKKEEEKLKQLEEDKKKILNNQNLNNNEQQPQQPNNQNLNNNTNNNVPNNLIQGTNNQVEELEKKRKEAFTNDAKDLAKKIDDFDQKSLKKLKVAKNDLKIEAIKFNEKYSDLIKLEEDKKEDEQDANIGTITKFLPKQKLVFEKQTNYMLSQNIVQAVFGFFCGMFASSDLFGQNQKRNHIIGAGSSAALSLALGCFNQNEKHSALSPKGMDRQCTRLGFNALGYASALLLKSYTTPVINRMLSLKK